MTAAALSLRDVGKAFGRTEIIREVNLEIAKGERHAIIGPNGAGKTTLFNLISGRFHISSGEILLNDIRIDALPPHRINRMGLSRSFQITSIFHRLSVFENLRCALLWSMGYHYSFWTPLWLQRELTQRTDAMILPYTKTVITSARSNTTFMSCSTITRVLPLETRRINSTALSVSLLLMPAVGSSSRMTEAPPAMVIPISSARWSA